MDDQAVDVWNMVEYSRSLGYRLRLGEVTVTELNFYRLRNYWTQSVYIDTYEPDEARTGADWEWLIGHGNDWVQIRVQAKIVNRTGSFDHLGHPKRTRVQMDRLIDPPTHCCRWMPLYVFYSAAPPAGYPVPPNRRSGCSVRLAEEVRDTYGATPATLTAARHLPGSSPWSSVFDGLVAHLNNQSLAAIIGRLAGQSFPPPPRTIDQFWDAGVTGGPCDLTLPVYAQAILDRRDDDFNGAPVCELIVRTPGDPPEVEAQGESLLPRRLLELDANQAEEVLPALPRFVAVIDIDRLPVGALEPVAGLERQFD